jgi:hypothetical protein
MLVYVFETKEWERRYLTEVVKDAELKFSEDRLNKDTAHKYKDARSGDRVCRLKSGQGGYRPTSKAQAYYHKEHRL